MPGIIDLKKMEIQLRDFEGKYYVSQENQKKY